MNRYDCCGHVKITIYENLASFADIEIEQILHLTRSDISIPFKVKQFFQDNINLLPREINKQLNERALNINICQKQIHFWWNELGRNRYKRDEDSFISAKKWLEEKEYNI
ncbi:10003_t:CDS:1, partial [Funneliformis mosseae]